MLGVIDQIVEELDSLLKVAYPPSLGAGFLTLLLAILLDALYPYHRGFLLRIHPVHTCFKLARKLAREYAERIRGIFLAIACILVHVVSLIVILALISATHSLIRELAWLVVFAWILKLSISIRLLLDTGFRIERRLEG